MLHTHGQGFTAVLGKKPTSFVDRILPWKHREITELRTSGWLCIHDSGTISLQHIVAANLQPWLTIGEIMDSRKRERGSVPNFSHGDHSDLWLNLYKQYFLEAIALSSPSYQLRHRRLMMPFLWWTVFQSWIPCFTCTWPITGLIHKQHGYKISFNVYAILCFWCVINIARVKLKNQSLKQTQSNFA